MFCLFGFQVYRHQNQFPSQISKEAALKMERKLTLVPVIFILVRIWGTTRFILYVSSPGRGMHKWEEVLLHLQVCFSHESCIAFFRDFIILPSPLETRRLFMS